MWPLTTEQVRLAIAEFASAPHALEDGEIHRAISWIGPELKRGDIFFAIEWNHHSIVAEALTNGAVCVVSKAWGGIVDLDSVQRTRCFVAADPLKAHRSLAGFMRKRFTFPVIAVGGSNGKTTTKDMIATVLGNKNVTSTSGTNNGWTGTPITLCHPLHRSGGGGQTERPLVACVIEIGIDEKGAMLDHVRIADPDIAVLTALGPEHLAGLGSHEDAIKEELVLFDAAKKRVWLGDEPELARRLDQVRKDDLVVGEEEGALRYEWHAPRLSITWEGATHDVVLPVPGAHNARNAALAIAVGILLGQPADECVRALATFRGPEQRCAITHPTPDLTLIDDTYNASPSSVEAALGVINDLSPSSTIERVIVLGDMLDLGAESDHWHASIAPLVASVGGKKNTHVRLYGDHMPKIAPLLGDELLSIGIAKKEEDPVTLIADLALHDQPRIVLVKGSRGMTLERVVAKVFAMAPATKRVGVLVDEDLARAMRARRQPHPSLFVQVLSLEDLERGEAQRTPFDIALIGENLPFRDNGDVEADLAAMAQLLVSLKPHGTAIFMADRDDHAEARALLIQVVPASCHVVRSGHSPHLG